VISDVKEAKKIKYNTTAGRNNINIKKYRPLKENIIKYN